MGKKVTKKMIITGNHKCHWDGCSATVPPSMWGCKKHWSMLPWSFKRDIWSTYRIGQEINKSPSMEYIRVAKEIRTWIKCYQTSKQFVKLLEVC